MKKEKTWWATLTLLLFLAFSLPLALATPMELVMISSTGSIQYDTVGTSYYVDSANGFDSNSGTSEDDPWQTLSKVKNYSFLPGDIIHLRSGSYWSEGLEINSFGVEAQPILVTSYGVGADPLIETSGLWSSGVKVNGDWVVVEKLKITGDIGVIGFYVSPGYGHNTIRYSEIFNVGVGVYFDKADFNLAFNNYIHDLVGMQDDWGAEGIHIESSNNEVSYNRFVNCKTTVPAYPWDGNVFEFYGTANNNYIHHNYAEGNAGITELSRGTYINNVVAYNVFVDNYYSGEEVSLHTSGGNIAVIQNLRFENNVIISRTGSYEPAWWLFRFYDANPTPDQFILRNNIIWSDKLIADKSGFTHDNNIYWSSDGTPELGFTLDSSEQVSDPLFVNIWSEDFHLQSGSPAINTGVDLGYSLDFDDNPVPIDEGPEIGAYEYE